MLRVYIPNNETNGYNYEDLFIGAKNLHGMPFELESDKFIITDDLTQCDIVPTMLLPGGHPSSFDVQSFIDKIKHVLDKVYILILKHTHVAEEDCADQFYQKCFDLFSPYTDKIIIAYTDITASTSHPNAINYDFLWNRQKAYYLEYDKYIGDQFRLWSMKTNKKMYELLDIEPIDLFDKNEFTFKKFLVPNRAQIDYHRRAPKRIIYRLLFMDYLDQKDAHYSNWDNYDCDGEYDPIILEPNDPTPFIPDGSNFNGFWPVSNYYYNTSIISAYVETLVDYTGIRSITEKTWEPLIKGHFILPLGYPELIDDIKSYGFILPDWIDYSYILEENPTERFFKYTQEYIRLNSTYSLIDLIKLRNRDIDILHHNRQLFIDRPYDSLHDKIIKVMK